MYMLLILIYWISGCSCYMRINKTVYKTFRNPYMAIKNTNQNMNTNTNTNTNTNNMNLVEYNDNVIEKIGIFSLSLALALLSDSPLKSLKKVGLQYNNFVLTSIEFMKNRSPNEMKRILVNLLRNIIPSFVKSFFRQQYIKDPQLIQEQSALWFTFNFLRWLVGPTEPIFDSKTSIKLIECRYLKESGCKSACLNLCKAPTQAFFSQVLGFPMTMEPDWDEKSCVFKFGELPPTIANDEAYGTSCYATCQIRDNTDVVMVNPPILSDGEGNYGEDEQNTYEHREAYLVSQDGIVRCN